jgi:hypothetical protein
LAYLWKNNLLNWHYDGISKNANRVDFEEHLPQQRKSKEEQKRHYRNHLYEVYH